MKDKIWIVTAFVLTFAVGVFVGALLVRSVGAPPFAAAPFARPNLRHFPRHDGKPPIPSMEMLQTQLGLDETQHQQIAGIVEKYRDNFQEHFRQRGAPLLVSAIRARVAGVVEERRDLQGAELVGGKTHAPADLL